MSAIQPTSFCYQIAPYFYKPEASKTKKLLGAIAAIISLPAVGVAGAVWNSTKAIKHLQGAQSKDYLDAAANDICIAAKIVSIPIVQLLLLTGVYVTFPVLFIPIFFCVCGMYLHVQNIFLEPLIIEAYVDKMRRQYHLPEDLLARIGHRQNGHLSTRFQNCFGTDWKLKVCRKELSENPEKILVTLYNTYYRLHPVVSDLIIQFKKEEGNDQGGLGREFLSLLFHGLAKKALNNQSKVYTFIRERSGTLPISSTQKESKPTLTAKQKEGYEVMGALFAFCAQNHGYIIGQVFALELFEIIQAYNYYELFLPFERLPLNTLMRLYEKRELNNPIIQKMFQCLKSTPQMLMAANTWNEELFYYAFPDEDIPDSFVTNGKPSLQKLEAEFSLFQEKVRQELAKLALHDPVLPCVHAIATGMHKSINNISGWPDSVDEDEGKELQMSIQGELSSETVLQAIECENDDVRGYFYRWISDATQDELDRFVKVATGATTLEQDWSLEVNLGPADDSRFIAFRTCSGTIDVPRYNSYNAFKIKLEESIKHAMLSGFTFQ